MPRSGHRIALRPDAYGAELLQPALHHHASKQSHRVGLALPCETYDLHCDNVRGGIAAFSQSEQLACAGIRIRHGLRDFVLKSLHANSRRRRQNSAFFVSRAVSPSPDESRAVSHRLAIGPGVAHRGQLRSVPARG